MQDNPELRKKKKVIASLDGTTVLARKEPKNMHLAAYIMTLLYHVL